MRAPDITIGDYLNKWYLIPHNNWFNIYLHQFIGSDHDRCLHDHPWWSVSFCLWGKLSEHYMNTGFRVNWVEQQTVRKIWWLIPYFRTAVHKHRIVLRSKTAWTLFITGPKIREWGFWPKGIWVPWKEYIDDNV